METKIKVVYDDQLHDVADSFSGVLEQLGCKVTMDDSVDSVITYVITKEDEFKYNQKEIGEWSNKMFGDPSVRGPMGPLSHLKDEIEELIADPRDRMEYADCFLLLVDAYRRQGGTLDDLIKAAHEKFEINKKREWGEKDPNDPDKAIYHKK